MAITHHLDLDAERHATWLELFYDLIYVIAISRLTNLVEHHLTWHTLFAYVTLFLPVFWAWITHTMHSTRFDSDDGYHRGMTFVMMFAAIVMAIAIPTALTTDHRIFALGFIISQIGLLLLMIRATIQVPAMKNVLLLYCIGFGLALALWVISLFVGEHTYLILWWIGIGINFSIPWLMRPILKGAPVSATHLPERLALFMIIVLGEVVASVVDSITQIHWSHATLVAAILSFLLAVNIWWQYYAYLERVDHSKFLGSGQPYIYTHIFLLLALGAVGAGVDLIIHDVSKDVASHHVAYLLCGALILWVVCFTALQLMGITKCALKRFGPYTLASILGLAFIGHLGHEPTWMMLVSVNAIMLVLALGYTNTTKRLKKMEAQTTKIS